MIREEVKQFINANGTGFEKVSDDVWGFAETCFVEVQSSKVQADYMEVNGFTVKRGVSGMETALRTKRPRASGCGSVWPSS